MTENKEQGSAVEHQARPSGNEVQPSTKIEAFCCPHCGAYTHQFWFSLLGIRIEKGKLPQILGDDTLERIKEMRIKGPNLEEGMLKRWEQTVEKYKTGKVFFEELKSIYSQLQINNIHLSKCFTCDEIAVWIHERLVFPPQRSGPEPNSDLPPDIIADYHEAQSILNLSPRGAAALLRLCVEKLVNHLDAEGSDLYEKIADLVRKGLDGRVQKSLDAVRVIGNEALHPGQLDLRDDRDTAETLFKLVNVIAEKMISEPKHVEKAYELLPPSKREAIERRDEDSK